MRDVILARGRARSEASMVDTCRVQRITDSQTDPLDGTVTHSYTTVYEGPCEIKQGAAPWAGPAEIGQAQVGLAALTLKLPISVAGVDKDDRVTCLTSRHDPELVGRVFLVQGAHHASYVTSRRLPLQETLS